MNHKLSYYGFLIVTALFLLPLQARSAVSIWIGLSNLWTDAANWDVAPVPGATLRFPAVAMNKTNINDLAADTVIEAINFDGGGYQVSGSSQIDLNNVSPSGPNFYRR